MTACGCVVVGFRNSRVECERAKEMVTLHVVCPSHTIPYSPLLQDQAWPVSIEPDRSGARKGRTRDRGRATEAEIPETWAGAGGLFCFRCGYWQICVERHRSFDQERAGADAECQVGGFAGLIANREGCETCYGPRPSCLPRHPPSRSKETEDTQSCGRRFDRFRTRTTRKRKNMHLCTVADAMIDSTLARKNRFPPRRLPSSSPSWLSSG